MLRRRRRRRRRRQRVWAFFLCYPLAQTAAGGRAARAFILALNSVVFGNKGGGWEGGGRHTLKVAFGVRVFFLLLSFILIRRLVRLVCLLSCVLPFLWGMAG